MTDQQVLGKAIKKAIAGGWQWQTIWSDKDFILDSFKETPRNYIYRHDFAKALWGEEPSGQVNVNPNIGSEHFRKFGVQNWQVHLQQMVIADDPLKYLEKSL